MNDLIINGIHGIRLAVIGSRDADIEECRKIMFELLDKNSSKIGLIVSGGAEGPDTLAEEWVNDRGGAKLIFKPIWRPNGVFDRGAGFRRNRLIISNSDHVLAFWTGSGGTKNSIDIAKQLEKPTTIINVKRKE